MGARPLNMLVLGLALALAAGASSLAHSVEAPDQGQHHHGSPAAPATTAIHPPETVRDTRQLVNYPDPLRIHTLANMRDHLSAMGEILEALGNGSFDEASELAEQRLGMSSLGLHRAHEVAKYMPEGMREAGFAMHRAASQFALVAKDASVTGDIEATLASLAKLNETCVACHAAYRLQ